MAANVTVIVSLLFFVAIMVIFTREKMDYVAYSLIFAIVSVLIALQYYPEFDVISYIEFEPIIFIISMQLIILLTEKNKIFQYIALKVLHITKGDHRKFFYLMCTISSFSAAIIADITVAIIFIPLIIRACRILKINAAPYLFGVSFTINIGSLYTPFSSSENILISSAFGLDFAWFLKIFTPFVIIVLFLTLYLLDRTMLRKIDPPEEERKAILLEIMHPGMVIVDKRKFLINSGIFIAIIIGFLFIEESYVVAAIGGCIMSLVNREAVTENLRDIDWKIILFFVALFMLIGTMEIAGLFDTIGHWAKGLISDNELVAAITLLFIIAVLSGFLAQVPTAIVFITLLNNIYGEGNIPALIIMAFLLGINLGSNFLPQGAACDLMALNLAERDKIEGFNYKTLLINGSKMTMIHIANSIIYLSIFSLFL